jgi:hypothetical protein
MILRIWIVFFLIGYQSFDLFLSDRETKKLYNAENANPAIRLSSAAYMVLMTTPGMRAVTVPSIVSIIESPPLGCIDSKSRTTSMPKLLIEHHVNRIIIGTVPMIRVVMENHLIFNFIVILLQ